MILHETAFIPVKEAKKDEHPVRRKVKEQVGVKVWKDLSIRCHFMQCISEKVSFIVTIPTSELNVTKSSGDHRLKLGTFGLYSAYFGKFFKTVTWVAASAFSVKRPNKGVTICRPVNLCLYCRHLSVQLQPPHAFCSTQELKPVVSVHLQHFWVSWY